MGAVGNRPSEDRPSRAQTGPDGQPLARLVRARARRRQARRRRAAVALVAVLVLGGLGAGAALGLGGSGPPASPRSLASSRDPRLAASRTSGTGHHRPRRAGAGAPKSSPGPTTTLPPSEPGGGRILFPGHRVVAFYGDADDPGLGVLGDAPPDQLWARLAAQAAPYAQPGVPALPAYELLAFVAQGAPGPAGTYAARVPDATIQRYLQVTRAHHGLLILDIQPGRGHFLADAQTLAPFLSQPDVALALDPEWSLEPGQVPDAQIGHTTGAVINEVSTWMEQLVVAHDLPQKLLLIHQFTADMVQDKPSVLARPDLAITFNMDGFGGQADKLSKYRLLASDPRFFLGLKLFYTKDVDMLSPTQVLGLQPVPSIVDYE